MSKKQHYKITVNGKEEEFLAEPRELLIYTLRERLNITGPHIGCETSHCGACTVTIDGKSVKACTMFVAQADGKDITTIEGIGGPHDLHPLQNAAVNAKHAITLRPAEILATPVALGEVDFRTDASSFYS